MIRANDSRTPLVGPSKACSHSTTWRNEFYSPGRQIPRPVPPQHSRRLLQTANPHCKPSHKHVIPFPSGPVPHLKPRSHLLDVSSELPVNCPNPGQIGSGSVV